MRGDKLFETSIVDIVKQFKEEQGQISISCYTEVDLYSIHYTEVDLYISVFSSVFCSFGDEATNSHA